MNTYKWIISSMDVVPSADGLTDVVKVIHWRLAGTDGQYQAETYSAISLDPPSSDDFTEFSELTEEQVVAWIESKVDVNILKESLDYQLESLRNPPIVTKPAPWNTIPVAVPPVVPATPEE